MNKGRRRQAAWGTCYVPRTNDQLSASSLDKTFPIQITVWFPSPEGTLTGVPHLKGAFAAHTQLTMGLEKTGKTGLFKKSCKSRF